MLYRPTIDYNEIGDMHELSITQSILSLTLEQAKKVNANKITKINLTIGELTGIVEECVHFYFELLSKDTIAAEASLSFDKPPTTAALPPLCHHLLTGKPDLGLPQLRRTEN